MGEEHPIDHQRDDPPTAGAIERVQARTTTRTQNSAMGAECREAEGLLGLGAQIALLLHQRLDAVVHYRAACLERVAGADLRRERLDQPLALALGTATCLLEVVAEGRPSIRHAFPSPGPPEGLSDAVRGAEPSASVVPDHRIEPIPPDGADTAMRCTPGGDARQVTSADIRRVGPPGPSRGGQPAPGTPDPGPPSIVAAGCYGAATRPGGGDAGPAPGRNTGGRLGVAQPRQAMRRGAGGAEADAGARPQSARHASVWVPPHHRDCHRPCRQRPRCSASLSPSQDARGCRRGGAALAGA
jgi:hypothetical protein